MQTASREFVQIGGHRGDKRKWRKRKIDHNATFPTLQITWLEVSGHSHLIAMRTVSLGKCVSALHRFARGTCMAFSCETTFKPYEPGL